MPSYQVVTDPVMSPNTCCTCCHVVYLQESGGLHRADSAGNILAGSAPPPMVPCSSYREPPSLYKRASAPEATPVNGLTASGSSSSSCSPDHYLGAAGMCRGEGPPGVTPVGRSDSPSLGKAPQQHFIGGPAVDLDLVSSSSAAAAAVARLQQAREAAAAAAAPKMSHSDVLQQQGDGRTMFLVPYKHSNGMAVYYRQTAPGEGLTNVSTHAPTQLVPCTACSCLVTRGAWRMPGCSKPGWCQHQQAQVQLYVAVTRTHHLQQ
jgi:hypothetical protein